uniref:Uncharacterized protein n=1 Tax=Rhizophora mucronata TaxID=61149 RepID=A0A2P2IIP5_RHIMU
MLKNEDVRFLKRSQSHMLLIKYSL